MNERLASASEAKNFVIQRLEEVNREIDSVLNALIDNEWLSLNQMLPKSSQLEFNEFSPEKIKSLIVALLQRFTNYEADALSPLRFSYDVIFQEENISNEYRVILKKLRLINNLLLFKGNIRRKSASEQCDENVKKFPTR